MARELDGEELTGAAAMADTDGTGFVRSAQRATSTPATISVTATDKSFPMAAIIPANTAYTARRATMSC